MLSDLGAPGADHLIGLTGHDLCGFTERRLVLGSEPGGLLELVEFLEVSGERAASSLP